MSVSCHRQRYPATNRLEPELQSQIYLHMCPRAISDLQDTLSPNIGPRWFLQNPSPGWWPPQARGEGACAVSVGLRGNDDGGSLALCGGATEYVRMEQSSKLQHHSTSSTASFHAPLTGVFSPLRVVRGAKVKDVLDFRCQPLQVNMPMPQRTREVWSVRKVVPRPFLSFCCSSRLVFGVTV